MPDRDDSALIWRGRSEARLDHLDACLDGIRVDVKSIQLDVQTLLKWRAQVVGMAIAWSSVVSTVVTYLVMKVLRVMW